MTSLTQFGTYGFLSALMAAQMTMALKIEGKKPKKRKSWLTVSHDFAKKVGPVL